MQSGKLTTSDRMIENRTFDEIAVGDSASLSRIVSKQDIELFAIISGDVNPAHLDPALLMRTCFMGSSRKACWRLG